MSFKIKLSDFMQLKTVKVVSTLLLIITFQCRSADSNLRGTVSETPRYLSDNAKDVIDEDVRILKKVLQYQLETLGPEHPICINLFLKLAAVYEQTGDLSQALIVYEQVIDLLDSRLGRDHAKVRALIPHLIQLYKELGRIPKNDESVQRLKEYLQQDIALIESVVQHQSGNLGKHHPKVMQLQLHLAKLYYNCHDWDKAGHLYNILLDIYQKKAKQNTITAPLMLRYGEVLWKQGKVEQAFQISREAVEVFTKLFGPTHPRVAEALRQLILIAIDNNLLGEAKEYSKTLFGVEDSVLEAVLAITSERDRFDYLAKHNPYALPVLLGDIQRLALVVLRHKGIILDSLIEDMRRGEAAQKPHLQELIKRRKMMKEKLVQHYFDETNGMPLENEGMTKHNIDILHEQIDTIEREIAHYVSGLDNVRQGLHLQVENIQKSMPKNSVLIEFIRYPLYAGLGRWNDHYGAIIIRPDDKPRWAPLGEARIIDKDIRTYHQLIAQKTSGDQQLSDILQVLYKRVWKPIDKKLDLSSRTIILSPDGMINFISFATLLTENDRFLGEKYLLNYITSGRDLLKIPKISEKKDMVIFSNPSYISIGNEPQSFPPLPGTAVESQKLSDLARKHKLLVTTFSGNEANEKNFRGIESPHILHIAAHGFFEETGGTEVSLRKYPITMIKDSRYLDGMIDNGYTINPMHKSGIALAANVTSEGSQREYDKSNYADGILTADEISLLNLHGTWLVVVPACYTGLGSLRAVEGLVGLRRGFVMAGGQNILTALWRVNDTTTTPDFMEDFYRSVFMTLNPVQSLAETQRKWLTRLRKRKGISSAVKEVGSFILISKEPFTKK